MTEIDKSHQLPFTALSVRQPWAWAIIYAGKDIENRDWRAINYGLRRRGRVAIHASKGMAEKEYRAAEEFMRNIGVACPPAHELLRGWIIGSVEIIDCVRESDSPWFMGPHGLVLRDPRPSEFIPSLGALGYFNWKRDWERDAASPLPWMNTTTPDKPAPDLFNPETGTV